MMVGRTYLAHKKQLDGTQCFGRLCRRGIAYGKPQVSERPRVVNKYVRRYMTAADTMAGMCCYDSSGGSVQRCTSAEPLRNMLEKGSISPSEIVFEVHEGSHRLYHRSGKKIRCAGRNNKNVDRLQRIIAG